MRPEIHARRPFRGIFGQGIGGLVDDLDLDFCHGANIRCYCFAISTVAYATRRLSTPHEPHLLCRRRLDRDVIDPYTQDARHGLAHGRSVFHDLRRLETNGAVDIDYAIPFPADQGNRLFEQDLAVDILVCRIGIGEMNANVSQAERPQQGIADGVNKYIRIAVAQRAFRTGNECATQPEWPAFDQLMKIYSGSDSIHKKRRPFEWTPQK